MSSQSEGGPPDQVPDPGPLEQFDAFRARRADDRAQQEAQCTYSFPPDYAPHAEYTAVAPEQHAPATPSGRDRGSDRRLRSVAIFAGAVVLAVAVGFGAYEAVGSSGPAANVTAGGGTPTPGAVATATAAAKRGRAMDVRVVIESIGPDSFTGRLVADGEQVTVRLDATTRFGTAAHPFSRGQLSVGETVLVRGRRSATATLTATAVVGG